MFRRYLSRLPRTAINESVTNLYRILVEASEGEAGKYFRKVVKEASPDVQRYLHEVTVETMDETCPEEPKENWLQWLWIWFRQDFGLRNNDTVYFAPGIARIMFANADSLDRFDYEPHQTLSRKAETLSKLVHYIQTAHKDSYTRYLVDKETGEPATFETLLSTFGDALRQSRVNRRKELENIEYTPNDYVIVELDDFDTASKFSKYTLLRPNDPDSGWCHLGGEETFDFYKSDGSVRLYLAYKPGFEHLKPGDKGYGQSMLGIDIGPGDELIHCNNRYNHACDPELDNVKNKPGDYRFDDEELSRLLGGPFYKFCPYYTAEERKARGIFTPEDFETALANGETIPKNVYDVQINLKNGDKVISVAKRENVIRNGKLLFPEWFEKIDVIDFGPEPGILFKIWNQDKVTLLTMDGKPFIDQWYDDIYHYDNENKYLVVTNLDRKNIITTDGQLGFNTWFKHLPQHLAGKVFYLYGEDEKYHFLDEHGNSISDIAADEIDRETDSYCYIRRNGKVNFLNLETMQPMLDPWCDSFRSEDTICGNFYIAVIKSDESFDDDKYNIVDRKNPDHYLLDKWACDYDIYHKNRYAIVYYINPETKQKTGYRFDTGTKTLIGNEQLNYGDTQNSNVDHIAHGLMPMDYVVTVKSGDETKMNIFRHQRPLLAEWADSITFEDDYYLIEYDGKTTVANKKGKLLLSHLYDIIYRIYSDQCIVVGIGSNPTKYNIMYNDKPVLDFWAFNQTFASAQDGDYIYTMSDGVIVRKNNKYNIFWKTGAWVFDQWKPGEELIGMYPALTMYLPEFRHSTPR